MIQSNQQTKKEDQLQLFNFIRGRKPISDNRKILDLIPDSIIGCCENGKINYWNKQSENLFGWSKSEVIGQSIEKLISPPGLLDIRRKKETVNRTIDLTGLHKSSRRIPIEMTVKTLAHGKKTYLFAFIRECIGKQQLNDQYQTLNIQNKILKKLLKSTAATHSEENTVLIMLEEVAKFKNCELAIVCKSNKERFTRLNLIHNRTNLNFDDFSHQVDLEVKDLHNKFFPLLPQLPNVRCISNIQCDWNNPFYIFGKNFGFHGCFSISLTMPDDSQQFLYFLSTQILDLTKADQKFLNETIENIETHLRFLRKEWPPNSTTGHH